MVLAALVGRGFDVLVPFGSGQSYDLVLDLANSDFLRVQCKTAWLQLGCLIFNSRSTDHGHGRASYEGLAEIFGVYSPANQSVYLIPVKAMPGFKGRLRLEPTRNNQRKGVRFAADFAIERWDLDALRSIGSSAAMDTEGALNFA